MKKSVLGVVVGMAWALNGCGGNVAPSAPAYQDDLPAANATTCCKVVDPVDPNAVSATGFVAGSSAMVDDASVLRFPSDAYIENALSTRTATNGSYAFDGLEGNSREWLVFEKSGFARTVLSFDTTKDAHQSLGVTNLLSDADAAQFAATLGVVQDPEKSVLRVKVVGAANADGTSPTLSDFKVTLMPSLDVPVYNVEGEAVVFNVTSYTYQYLTVTSAGRTCRPAAHPELVASDGSVAIVTLDGSWTIAPVIRCE